MKAKKAACMELVERKYEEETRVNRERCGIYSPRRERGGLETRRAGPSKVYQR